MASGSVILLLAAPLLIWGLTSAHKRREDGEPAVVPPPPPPKRPPIPTTPIEGPPMTETDSGIGSTWLELFDEVWSPEREETVRHLILGGKNDPIDFTFVVSSGRAGTPLAGYSLQIPVMDDAFMVEGVRLEGTFETNQRLADWLNLTMFTPYVAGLVSEQADAKIAPTTQSPTTATKTDMIRASASVDAKLKAFPQAKLMRNAGKYWVLTRRYLEAAPHPSNNLAKLDSGANHGLYTSPWNPIQNVGTAHGWNWQGPGGAHTDYSQVLRFIGPEGILTSPDGKKSPVLTKTLVMDPLLAPLMTGEFNRLRGKQLGEGVLAYDRHPSIPETPNPLGGVSTV